MNGGGWVAERVSGWLRGKGERGKGGEGGIKGDTHLPLKGCRWKDSC